MKLICSKANLLKGVNIVSKAVPTRTTMAILECILIDASANEIKLMANDMELGIETIIDGTIEEVNSAAPIDKKFEAFGWHVITIDGHNFEEIENALKEAETVDKPVAIIAKTVKGKGVSFMENAVGWHGSAPNDEQYEQAMTELNAALAALN